MSIDQKLIQSFKALGARMSVKMHYGDYTEEKGERFHQDIRTVEERYQERWDINMLVDYCWCLNHDLPSYYNT